MVWVARPGAVRERHGHVAVRDHASCAINYVDVARFEQDADVILVIWMEAEADDRTPYATVDVLGVIVPVVLPLWTVG